VPVIETHHLSDPNMVFRTHDYAKALVLQATVERRLGDAGASVRTMKRAQAVARRLLSASVEHVEFKRLVVHTAEGLAESLLAAGRADDALDVLQDAKAHLDSLLSNDAELGDRTQAAVLDFVKAKALLTLRGVEDREGLRLLTSSHEALDKLHASKKLAVPMDAYWAEAEYMLGNPMPELPGQSMPADVVAAAVEDAELRRIRRERPLMQANSARDGAPPQAPASEADSAAEEASPARVRLAPTAKAQRVRLPGAQNTKARQPQRARPSQGSQGVRPPLTKPRPPAKAKPAVRMPGPARAKPPQKANAR
jgi:hypothetical protein